MHIRVMKEETHMVLRAAGKRIDFDPTPEDNTTCMEHKYMYGQNVLFARI